jgi:hypothetical protein
MIDNDLPGARGYSAVFAPLTGSRWNATISKLNACHTVYRETVRQDGGRAGSKKNR